MAELKPLNHTGTVHLETERLILRPTSVIDAAQMYNNWASDPEVTKYLHWQPHANIDITKSILTSWESLYINPDYYHWGIVIREIDEIVGTCAVMSVNEKNNCAEIGYCMGRAYWGKGYMSEAVSAIIKYLINIVGFNRIVACHDPNNIGSGRVMQKCGMTFEGIHRQAAFCVRRGFYDLAYYAIIKDDLEVKQNR